MERNEFNHKDGGFVFRSTETPSMQRILWEDGSRENMKERRKGRRKEKGRKGRLKRGSKEDRREDKRQIYGVKPKDRRRDGTREVEAESD